MNYECVNYNEINCFDFRKAFFDIFSNQSQKDKDHFCDSKKTAASFNLNY